jgi:hypothetical protein
VGWIGGGDRLVTTAHKPLLQTTIYSVKSKRKILISQRTKPF